MGTIFIADDDSLVGKLGREPADLLISLGDLWDSTIGEARVACGCSAALAVKGNHDSAARFGEGIVDLHLNVVTIDGVRFGGFGGSWKYKPRGHHLFEQSEVVQALAAFPEVDVFVAHNSPAGIHERDADVHRGFEAFVDYIDRVQPAYFFHGHQHVNEESRRGKTVIKGVFGEEVFDLRVNQ